MERLKALKEKFLSKVESQDLDCADTKELGEAIDIIKDLDMAMYYCSVAEAMNASKEEKEAMEKVMLTNMMNSNQYQPMMYTERYPYANRPMYYPPSSNEMDRQYRQMYDYDRDNSPSRYYPTEIRDYREGNNGISRRMYMESKEMHQSKDVQAKKLDRFVMDLKDDLTEMVKGADPEHKQKLQKDILNIANYIEQMK